MLSALYPINPNSSINILGTDIVNLGRNQLTVELQSWSLYSTEKSEDFQMFQRIETQHEWLELDAYKNKYFIKSSNLSTHKTIVYPKEAGYFNFCQGYLFPYKQGNLPAYANKSKIITNSDITGYFLCDINSTTSKKLHTELLKRKCGSIVENFLEGKYRVGRFVLNYKALTRDIDIKTFYEIITSSKVGIGDMTMINHAFVYWGFENIAPSKPLMYLKDYILERLQGRDNKLMGLVLSEV